MDTKLIDAVKAGDIASARQILATGADVNSRDAEGSYGTDAGGACG